MTIALGLKSSSLAARTKRSASLKMATTQEDIRLQLFKLAHNAADIRHIDGVGLNRQHFPDHTLLPRSGRLEPR